MTKFLAGWEQKKLGEICEILDSQRIPVNSIDRAKIRGPFPYYGANGIQDYINDYIFEGPSVLLAEDGGYFDEYDTRPIAQYVEGKYWVNNHAHIIRGLAGQKTKWIFYALVHKNILRFINGGTRAKLNQSDLKEIQLLVPPTNQQQKIAEILTSVDEVIENTQSQINKLEDLKKATMNELLTKGIGHTEFKETEIGRIPRNWSFIEMGKITEFMTNGFVGSAAQHYRKTGVRYLMAKNIRENLIDNRNLTYISKQFHEESIRSQLKNGDLLTVQSGHIGTSAVVGSDFDDSNCHALIVSRFHRNKVNPYFVSFYFNSDTGKKRLSGIYVGSTIQHINTKDLKHFEIPLPTLDEQNQIVAILQSCVNLIRNNEVKLERVLKLKHSLMQDLLTGKVRVTVN